MNRVVIIIGVLICGAMFLLNAWVHHISFALVHSGKAISPFMALVLALSAFWGQFWWMLIPMIFGALLSVQYIRILLNEKSS